MLIMHFMQRPNCALKAENNPTEKTAMLDDEYSDEYGHL